MASMDVGTSPAKSKRKAQAPTQRRPEQLNDDSHEFFMYRQPQSEAPPEDHSGKQPARTGTTNGSSASRDASMAMQCDSAALDCLSSSESSGIDEDAPSKVAPDVVITRVANRNYRYVRPPIRVSVGHAPLPDSVTIAAFPVKIPGPVQRDQMQLLVQTNKEATLQFSSEHSVGVMGLDMSHIIAHCVDRKRHPVCFWLSEPQFGEAELNLGLTEEAFAACVPEVSQILFLVFPHIGVLSSTLTTEKIFEVAFEKQPHTVRQLLIRFVAEVCSP